MPPRRTSALLLSTRSPKFLVHIIQLGHAALSTSRVAGLPGEGRDGGAERGPIFIDTLSATAALL